MNLLSEVLIHLIIPAAALIVVGFDRKLVLLLCPFAVLPDIDILFGIHRQALHSIFVLGSFSFILLMFTFHYKPQWKTYAIIITLLLLSHPLLDLITGPIQILWPIDLHFHLKFVAPLLDPTTLSLSFPEFPVQFLIYTPQTVPIIAQPFPIFENTGVIAFILIGIAILYWLLISRKKEAQKNQTKVLPMEENP